MKTPNRGDASIVTIVIVVVGILAAIWLWQNIR